MNRDPQHVAARFIARALTIVPVGQRKALLVAGLQQIARGLTVIMGPEEAAMTIYQVGDETIAPRKDHAA
jgi:hypothetical protein